MSFNVLMDDWIPVRDQDGIHDMSILQVLEHAPEYLEIVDASPQYEFGIYRMLFAFLMDAYRPAGEWEIKRILKKGCFDMEKISNYIAECNLNGERFDLFDQEHPFLQIPLKEWENAEGVPVANMINFRPHGNNHIHFEHTLDREQEIDYKEAAKLLCSLSLFCTSMTQEYPSTVNGAPPTYCLVKGENLFETLVYGMVPSGNYENYADPPAIWHDNQKVEAKRKVAISSVLYLLTFPCRRVTLKPESDNKVREIHFGQGMNFVGYESFRDPYVSYLRSDKGQFALKPQVAKEAWRNIGTIMDCHAKTAPTVVQQFLKLTERVNVSVNLYEVVTEKAAYYDERKNLLEVPQRILRDSIRFNVMQESVACAEDLSIKLESICKRLADRLNRLDKDKKMKSAILAQCREAKKRFLAAARDKFFSELLGELNTDQPDNENINKEWRKQMFIRCMQEYDYFADTVCSNSYMLTNAVEVKQDFLRSLSKKKEDKQNVQEREKNED